MGAEPTRVRITKRVIDGASAPVAGEARLWDSEVRGLCLRLYPTGRKVYSVKYRVDDRQRWHTIGVHGQPWRESGALTAEEARLEAKRILGAAVEGRDASAERARRRERVGLTVANLIDRYLLEAPAARPDKRASSWAADRSNLQHHVRPLLGGKLAAQVTGDDVRAALKRVAEGETAREPQKARHGRVHVRGGAGIATRVLSATRAMFSWAVAKELVPNNPARGIKLDQRPAKERFLSPEEALRLGAALDRLEAEGTVRGEHADMVRLLLLTGARKGEIEGLRWSEVDLARRRLSLPPERTKAGGKTGQRRIPLSTTAAAILAARRVEGASGYVFPGVRRDGPLAGLQRAWVAAREAAKLSDVRLHDLRHSFASFALVDGASLALIGRALGHSETRTTDRYAHLSDDPLLELAERAGRHLTRPERP